MQEATQNSITSFVIIRQSRVIKNGDVLYESNTAGINFLKEAFEEGFKIDYPKFYKMDALCKTGIIAAHVLLKNASIHHYNAQDIGIVLSNCNGSIEADTNYFESSKTFPSPSLFVYTLPNIIIGEISIRYKFKGENAFFITENFDAEQLYFYVNDLFNRNKINACICGWVDVINDNFDACLFLVERDEKQGTTSFTAQNLNEIYNSVN